MRIHPIFHVSKLKPYLEVEDPQQFPDRQQLDRPAPVIEEDGSEYYTIERIIDKRVRKIKNRKVTQYLAKWLGYDESESTWITKGDLTADAHCFIDEYEQRVLNQNGEVLVDF